MARKELIDRAGRFDPRLSQCADWDMWLRVSLLTRFLPVHEALTLYRVAPGTMSSDPALLERDTFALLDKFYADPASLPYASNPEARLRQSGDGLRGDVPSCPPAAGRDEVRTHRSPQRSADGRPARVPTRPMGGSRAPPRARRAAAGSEIRQPSRLTPSRRS